MNFPSPDSYDSILLYLGFVILIASLFPNVLRKYLITSPIMYLLISVVVFTFFKEVPFASFTEDPYLGKRITELGVIISLTSAGLKLQAPFKWKSWRISFRLLIITMPLTIMGIYFLGWVGLGMAPATAMLFGAVTAPTDPVLASDVQTSPPNKKDVSKAKLALTTEAGLNDGLAFPFTNMAIAMAVLGANPSFWFADWFMIDFLYKIIVGTIIGYGSGWLLYRLITFAPKPTSHQMVIGVGLLSLSLTLVPYGLAEMAQSYGFISVFVAACVFRNQENINEYLESLHQFSEELERVLVLVLFTLAGLYITKEFDSAFQWYMVPVAIIVVFVIRPLAGYIGLIGTDLPVKKKWLISFFGIRGIGSLYYIFYALEKAEFSGSEDLFAILMVIIVISLLVHGMSARQLFAKITPGK